MIRIALRISRYAGILVCSALLAATPAIAQQVVRTTGETSSIVSLAPSPHPVGAFLARRAGDATFEKAPANYHVFAAANAGEDANLESLTLNFAGATTLTGIRTTNKDFVIQSGGSCNEGNHYTRGQSCSLLVRFRPQGPGHRLGFVKVTHSAEATPTVLGLTGNGYAPSISFIPSTITTVPGTYVAGKGTISSATNLAIDGGDILYIPDTGNDLIKEIDSSGAITPLTPFFAVPASLAVDSLGIIYSASTPASSYYFAYYMPWGSQTAYGNAYASGACTPTAPCSLSTVGMSHPANMSIDAYDNLIFEEGTKGAAEMPVTNMSGGTGSFNLWYLTDQFNYASGTPTSFAVDSNGNLYNDYTYTAANTCYLMEEGLYSAEYSPTANRVAGGVKCGFSGDGGLAKGAEISTTIGQIAFDAAGNLYFADAGNQRVRRIDNVTGIIQTIAGVATGGYSGDGLAATHAQLANPTGVAVDSQGQVYIISGTTTTGTAQVLRKVTNLGRQAFASTVVSHPSSVLKVIVSNTGNSTMTLSSTFWSGANPGDFKVNPTNTNCVLTSGSVLTVGQTCTIGFLFTPAAVGARAGIFNMVSNTIAGENQILLTGTGVTTGTVEFKTPLANADLAAGSTVSVQVGVTSSYSVAPTGTVTFKIDGVQVGSPVSLVSGVASVTLNNLSVGSHSLDATYNGDQHTAAASAAETISVKASPATMTSPVSGSSLSGTAATFQWSPGSGATGYSLYIGTTRGAHDLAYINAGSATSASTTSLPANNSTVYVTLYSLIGGHWQSSSYQYTSVP